MGSTGNGTKSKPPQALRSVPLFNDSLYFLFNDSLYFLLRSPNSNCFYFLSDLRMLYTLSYLSAFTYAPFAQNVPLFTLHHMNSYSSSRSCLNVTSIATQKIYSIKLHISPSTIFIAQNYISHLQNCSRPITTHIALCVPTTPAHAPPHTTWSISWNRS